MAVPGNPGEFEVVFDRAAVLEHLMDDEELIAELVVGFLQDAPAQLDTLEQAAAAGDFVRMERIAHRVKGSSSMLGANAFRAVAQALEQASHAGRREEALGLVPLLFSEFRRLEPVMRDSLPG